ncbi:hypothetical protein HMPREF9061_00333 [Actinomyces sp. oral taxon 181 str. F0379]|nr:hypothetical protein HMPREF9061_00333 [Actinomyces sp. oral taxon 181 str. F0379]
MTQARREGTCIQARKLSAVIATATASTGLSRLLSLFGRNITKFEFGQVGIRFDHEIPFVGLGD